MKFAIAVHGTRGDVEPAAALALELQRRGHQVSIAVPPNLVGFVESAGLFPAIGYGPDSQKQVESEVFREWWKLRNPIAALRQARAYVVEGWAGMGETLAEVAAGAQLIVSGTTYQEVAANVAEAQGVPLAALHYFPFRANAHILPVRLPEPLVGGLWAGAEWAHWRLLKPADDAQRRSLGLPASRTRAVRRMIEQGTLEIQAYDPLFFPGLAEAWRGKRPVVGGLGLDRPTPADASVRAWIDAGPPPIHFGFGSMMIGNARATCAMMIAACRDLGERALIVSGRLALDDVASTHEVMVVPAVNHADIFPRCKAIVHHGGAGTVMASVRSGKPTLVLWVGADQPVWAAQVRRLGVGTSRRLSATTPATLRADLQTVLAPACAAKARDAALRMTPLRDSLSAAADLLEDRAARHAPGLTASRDDARRTMGGQACG